MSRTAIAGRGVGRDIVLVVAALATQIGLMLVAAM
jgi:hypothetical protein